MAGRKADGLPEPFTQLRDPVVRDLAWAVASPPLFGATPGDALWPDTHWFSELASQSAEHLFALDAEPSALHAATDTRRGGRLGRYFESLWWFWLTDNPRYTLRSHNIPVRDAQRTHGELDCIVEDRRTGTLEHWELAVKFYLGQGATDNPQAWLGPFVSDRLDLKLARLREHQLPLLHHPETRRQLQADNLTITTQRVILKGRLFYQHAADPEPCGANPAHLRAWWMRLPQFVAADRFQSLSWIPLAREQWLAPLRDTGGAGLPAAELARRLDTAGFERPLCVAGFDAGGECERGFLVPANWPRPTHST